MEAGVIGQLFQLALLLVDLALKHVQEHAPILSLQMVDLHAQEMQQKYKDAIFKHAECVTDLD